MPTPSHLTSRDLSAALWFLLGIGARWFIPYAVSRWFPDAWLLGMIGSLISFVFTLLATLSLLLRPFVEKPRDLRGTQWLLRLGFLSGIGIWLYSDKQLPNAAFLGDWHRLTDHAKAEDFRLLSQWLIKEAAHRPELMQLENKALTEFLTSPDGAQFASITQIWDEPNFIAVEERPNPTVVYFNWGGGFGHWGVVVHLDSAPLPSSKHSKVWNWDEGVYFWTEIQ
jgi:hypothetical protein